MELLKWFKTEFFQWFDAPTCAQCQRKMTAHGTQVPTQEDLIWGASRVELYSCKVSGGGVNEGEHDFDSSSCSLISVFCSVQLII